MIRTPGTLEKAHTLYRFWNSAGELLYVGIAGDPGSRWLQHGRDKQWWREVDRVSVSHFDSRPGVEAAEVLAIRTENPRYNVQHSPEKPVRLRTALPLSGSTLSEDEFLALILSVTQIGGPNPACEFTVRRDLATGDGIVSVITGPGQFVPTNSGGGIMRYPSVDIPVSCERASELRSSR